VASETPPSSSPLEERFLGLVRRELESDEASLLEPGSVVEDAPELISAQLEDGRQVVARFATPPENREVLSRRLAILVSTFAESLRTPARPASRPPVTTSLLEELQVLAARAQAIDVVVIDAHSPVVWGSARGFFEQVAVDAPEVQEAIRLIRISRIELLQLVKGDASDSETAPDEASSQPEQETERRPPTLSVTIGGAADKKEPELPEGADAASAALTRRAIHAIRELPAIARLRRGRVLHHSFQSESFGYLVQSFASIYLVLLVFDGLFDEFRAERALQDALPRIERLVLALPPHDPTPAPMGAVIRLSRRRR